MSETPLSPQLSSPVQLKRGDLVRLNSGGPVMTVETVNDKKVTCCWFDIDATTNLYVGMMRDSFALESLTLLKVS